MKVHNPNNLPTIPIADLLPSQGDLKDLSEKEYNKLKNVIIRRGFSVPVYIWEDKEGIKHLLDGHGRRRVLTTEGWDEPVPYLKIPAKDMQEAMARLLEITSQYQKITQEGIDQFIATYELPEAEVYDATSFDALGKYGDEEEPEIEEDEAPEVDESEAPKSKLGEVYQLGRHRVMCGDSTSLTDAEILMNGDRASIAFTSPPYNAGTTPTEVKMNKKSKYANDSDNKSQDDYFDFMQLWTNIANEYSEYNFVNVQMLSGNKLALIDYLSIYRNTLADIMIWNKLTAQPAMADNVLNSQFEFIVVFSEKANRAIGTKHFRGTASNVLDISKQTNNEVKDHNATFPVELPHNIVTTFSNKDEIILDLFLGSGSTLIACEQTDRTCYGMELDPKYVDVIRKRYAKFVSPENELPENWEELTKAI